MIKNVLNILCTLLLLACFSCSSPDNCESICIKEGRGVWKMSVGTPEDVTLLSLLDISPNWKAIEEIEEVDFPINWDEIKTEVVGGRTYVRFPLEKEEKFMVWG